MSVLKIAELSRQVEFLKKENVELHNRLHATLAQLQTLVDECSGVRGATHRTNERTRAPHWTTLESARTVLMGAPEAAEVQ